MGAQTLVNAAFEIFVETAHSTNTQVLVGCCFAYVVYYFTHVAKKPELFCKEGKFQRLLLSKVPVLEERYCPTFWCSDGRAQSLVGSVLKHAAHIQYDQLEDVECSDGGEVHLHWKMGRGEDEERPIVLILPGLTGTSNATYARNFVKQAEEMGYRSVVMNYRGHMYDLKTPRLYCACVTDDLGHVVDRIKSRYPNAPLTAVGVSLGGMILCHYLAKRGLQTDIVGAMIVSVPFHPEEASKEIARPLNNFLFNRFLARQLVHSVKKYLHMFKDRVDWDNVMNSQTVREFDTHFTSTVFDFKSISDYYASAALYDKLHHVRTPILFIHSSDDPFSPLRCIPTEEALVHDTIAIALTNRGGHVGFVEGFTGIGLGYADRLFCQYIPALVDNREILDSLTQP